MRTQKKDNLRYIFGPVPSRRLGMSLGVDLMPHKTCSLNCIYCECGATTCHTAERKEYVPSDEVMAELSLVLSREPEIDYITFSGSGEPTLHSGIGDIIRFLRSVFSKYRLAVLTNGTLFYREDVREQLLDVDVVKVSLDGASKDVFNRINRPCPGLNLDEIIDGLIRFRRRYGNRFWVEVFLIPGINDIPEELEKIKTIIGLLNPHKIQINTLDRPGTEKWVQAERAEKLKHIAFYLNHAEIISSHVTDTFDESESGDQPRSLSGSQISERILTTIKRRPCTIEDMSRLLGLNMDEVQYHLETLMKTRKILKKEMSRGIFYMIRL